MAKPSPTSPPAPRLLVLELWGVGDLALALPFLRAASNSRRVTLLAKPQAAPLLARFAPAVELLTLTAPWTSFRGKYRLLEWPWGELWRLRRELRARNFESGVSARPDPRDHALLVLAGARHRLGFARAGSGLFLDRPLTRPALPHRAAHWAALARALDFPLDAPPPRPRFGKKIIVHTGAGSPVRAWPLDRYAAIARRLEGSGWNVTLLDDSARGLDRLLTELDTADRFLGNDSGPGHLAALLGVPTFTVFGPQLPESFAPQHPQAAWIEGKPCPYKPCFDSCRFPRPHCLLDVSVDEVWSRLGAWLERTPERG